MQTWLDDEEREGVASYAISRARMEWAGPIDPWDMAKLLSVRVERLRVPGVDGQCVEEPPTVWIRDRGSAHTVAGRLAHELAHLAAMWCRAPNPHCERSVDDIAARILVPSRWVRWAIRRGIAREKMAEACVFVSRAESLRRIRQAASDE